MTECALPDCPQLVPDQRGGSCQANSNCNKLAIGCADTYGSGLNDGKWGVAKFEVNPTTGAWPSNWVASATGNTTIRGRLQCEAAECADANSVYVSQAPGRKK